MHGGVHDFDALVARSDGLRERGLKAPIGRDQPRVLLIRHAYRSRGLLIASSVAMRSALSNRGRFAPLVTTGSNKS